MQDLSHLWHKGWQQPTEWRFPHCAGAFSSSTEPRTGNRPSESKTVENKTTSSSFFSVSPKIAGIFQGVPRSDLPDKQHRQASRPHHPAPPSLPRIIVCYFREGLRCAEAGGGRPRPGDVPRRCALEHQNVKKIRGKDAPPRAPCLEQSK